MGWEVHPTLDSAGPVKALYRALETGEAVSFKDLIHHSDRSGQYCSALYTGILKLHGIRVSVTQDGSPYDNVLPEAGGKMNKSFHNVSQNCHTTIFYMIFNFFRSTRETD